MLAAAGYCLLGPWLLYRGYVVVGALAMIISASAPLVAQIALTDSEMPGTALLFMLMSPLPLVVLVGRVLFLLMRGFRRLAQFREQIL